MGWSPGESNPEIVTYRSAVLPENRDKQPCFHPPESLSILLDPGPLLTCQQTRQPASGRGSSSRSIVKVRPSASSIGSLPVPYLWVRAVT